MSQPLPTDPAEREALLRDRLTPEQYHVTQQAGTERAFTGIYWDTNDDGVYRCVVCDTALFTSDTKYDSGTGWPSFWTAVDDGAVTTNVDRTARDGPHRGALRHLRRPPRPRLPRRPRADGAALLHELGLAATRPRRRRGRRRRLRPASDPTPGGGVQRARSRRRRWSSREITVN